MPSKLAAAAARLTPPELVRRLRVDVADTPDRDGNQAAAFRWAHMGHSDLSVRALLTTIREAAGLHPPRTGHVGNWNDIVAGRAGAMDFNQGACVHGSAYALLYPFNKTE